jgi:hypothetical protein
MKQPLKSSIDYDQAPELTAADIKKMRPLSELLAKLDHKKPIKAAKLRPAANRILHAA